MKARRRRWLNALTMLSLLAAGASATIWFGSRGEAQALELAVGRHHFIEAAFDDESLMLACARTSRAHPFPAVQHCVSHDHAFRAAPLYLGIVLMKGGWARGGHGFGVVRGYDARDAGWMVMVPQCFPVAASPLTAAGIGYLRYRCRRLPHPGV